MPENPSNSSRLPGVIYVGRTEGEQITVLGKVGQVENPEFLEGRVVSYRVADRVFHFVLEGAFAVELPPSVSIAKVESWVHSCLKGEGLLKIGENFEAPEGSMTFLARMVQTALGRLGHPFRALDIDALQARARTLNSETWKKLRKKKGRKGDEQNVYHQWLTRQCRGDEGVQAMARPRDYVRQTMALGYLLRDLAAGSDVECIQVPLIRSGVLKIYPTNLPSALFEAKAEADLNLASTTSYSACPSSLDQIPVEPFAMRILVGQTLEMLEVPSAFLPPTKTRPEEVRISPDHLAALGLLGGFYDEGCFYEGLGVRAPLPLDLYEIVRGCPNLLPGIRFWQGVRHCREQGFRIQDFELPVSTLPLWDRAFDAADELERLGRPVPASVRAWVSHAWSPTAANSPMI